MDFGSRRTRRQVLAMLGAGLLSPLAAACSTQREITLNLPQPTASHSGARVPTPQTPTPTPFPITPKADMIGVAGNAFPWEPDFTTFERLLAESQVGWARVELRWETIQPSRGTWNWGLYDKLVSSYHQLGMQQLGLLCYSVGWASGGTSTRAVFGPPTDLDAWEQYVRQTVTRYKGQIHAWEIWNEPDVAMFWNNQDGGSPKDYLPLLQRAYTAIKAADPNAVVMNGGVTGTGRGADYIHRLLDLGGGASLDAVAFHGYMPAESLDDEFYPKAVWPLINAVQQRAGKPLWITEFGWSSTGQGGQNAGSEEAQNGLLARHLPMLFDLSGLARAFIFLFKDPNDQGNGYGLVRSNGTPKPAYTTIQTMAGRLAGLNFQQLAAGPGQPNWDVRFGDASHTVDILWSQHGSGQITLPVQHSPATLWELPGGSQPMAAPEGALTLTLSTTPILLERST